MLVQICIILRMAVNDGNQLTLDRYEIVPCEDSLESVRDVRDNTLKVYNEQTVRENLLALKPQLNLLWTHNPMARMMLPQPNELVWSRPAVFRKPSLSLTKLSKSLQSDFSPSFRKSDFEFEARNKPITLLAFRNPKNGPAQENIKYKTSGELNSREVAEMQSPYNDVSAFWQDEKNA